MNTTKSSVTCTNCGGQLLLDDDQSTVTCEYCGSQFLVSDLLDESDEIQLEKLRQRAAREKEKKEKEEEKQLLGKLFQQSFFGKLYLVLAFFCAIFAIESFTTGSVGAVLTGVFSLAQAGLFTAAFLFGANLIPEPIPKARLYAALSAFLLFFPTGILASVFYVYSRLFVFLPVGLIIVFVYGFVLPLVKNEEKKNNQK